MSSTRHDAPKSRLLDPLWVCRLAGVRDSPAFQLGCPPNPFGQCYPLGDLASDFFWSIPDCCTVHRLLSVALYSFEPTMSGTFCTLSCSSGAFLALSGHSVHTPVTQVSPVKLRQRAPNTCIGGSGTRAVVAFMGSLSVLPLGFGGGSRFLLPLVAWLCVHVEGPGLGFTACSLFSLELTAPGFEVPVQPHALFPSLLRLHSPGLWSCVCLHSQWTQPVEGSMPIQVLPFLLLNRAPNTRIGGSGARADSWQAGHGMQLPCVTPLQTVPTTGGLDVPTALGFGDSLPQFCFRCQIGTSVALGYQPESHSQLYWQLELLALQSEALLLSSALFLLLLLLAALMRPLRMHKLPCLAPVGQFARGLNLGALYIFGASCPHRVVLDWSTHKPCRRKHGSSCPTVGCGLCRLVLWLLLWYELPQPVYASSLTGARWYLLPLAAQAMARPPREEDPPGQAFATRRPHLIPPHELTTHVGTCNDVIVQEPLDPFEGCETRVLSLSSPCLQRMNDDLTSDQDWLGVHLYTPHYQPLQLAIRPKEKTLESVLELLVTYDQGPDGRLFDTVVPIRPQQFHGSGSFLRFSSSIRGVGAGGMVAIIMDLTAVGGLFFSTVLPKDIAFQTLKAYVGPLTTLGEEPADIFVGCCDRPLQDDTPVHLSDGDVVLVLKQNCGLPSHNTASSLFEVDAIWAPPDNCRRITACTSVCVLHKEKRYCIPDSQHQGQSLVQYVSEMLQLNPYCMVTCTFPIIDLEVQGQACPFVVAVAEVPSPEVTGVNRDAARDIFILLDPRPMGHKPCFLFLHHPVVHLPSAAAMLGLSTGRARRLGVRGGERRGDDVFVEGCTALVLYAEEIDEMSDASDSSARSEDFGAGPPFGQEIEPVAAPPGLSLQSITCDDSSSPVGDVWGGGPQLTMEGVDVFDPAIPEGQSWNLDRVAVRGGDVAAAVASEEPAIEMTSGPAVFAGDAVILLPKRLLVLIYVPDFVPEILEVCIALPAAIEGLKAQVQDMRSAEQSFSFPDLSPVSPQPLREVAIFVASPAWQTYTVMVLFDCRRYNDCIFAQAVPRALSRESLLRAAGVPPDDPVHVFVHGLIRPLTIDQRITLVHGMTISISPRDEGSPAHSDLSEMLLTEEGWDRTAPIPGPTVHFNSHFLILTEGAPFVFQVQPGRQVTFRDDVARATGTEEHRLSLGTVTPRIIDAYPYGYWTSAVLVATDALLRVPYPPARNQERRSILVLDQRRILRGLAWRFVFSRVQKVQDLADLYYHMCPPGHVVSLDGPRVDIRDGVQVFLLQPGQVLTVEFVPEQQSSPPSEQDLGPADIPLRAQPPAANPTAEVPIAPGNGHAGCLSQNDSTRSRSPRGRTQHEVLPSCDLPGTPWRGKLGNGFPALRPKTVPQGRKHDCTVWLSSHGAACTLCVGFPLVLARDTPGSVCKLLQESPEAAPPHPMFVAARDVTRMLGGDWPLPPYRWPIDMPALDVDGLSDVEVDEGTTTDIVVFLLTPDYSPERLDLTVELPQTVDELTDLVQTCRDAVRHRLFPALIEVQQQPDAGWGLFLAVPLWLQHHAVVCVDASLYDGRVFAISVSANTDRYMLCELAGLAPTAEVDVFVPGHDDPIPPGAECQVATGMCVVFVRPGRGRPASFRLSETLRSRVFWEHSPMFPQDSHGNGYCIAGPAGQILFRLHPERAFFYRAEIALLTDLHPLRVVVTPAEPQQVDVSVRGWLCRTVVSATDRDDQAMWDGTEVSATPGLLDCRPLLIGWLPVSARAHWLDLEPIRFALNQSAPPGWCVCFPDLPAHWTWVCFHAGKVIKVAFEEHTGPSLLEPSAAIGYPAHGQRTEEDQSWRDDPRTASTLASESITPLTLSRSPGYRQHRLPSWHMTVIVCLAGALSFVISWGEIHVSLVACAVLFSHYPLLGAICFAEELTLVEGMQFDVSRRLPEMPPARRPLPTPARAGMLTAQYHDNAKVLNPSIPAVNATWGACSDVSGVDLTHLTTLLEDSLGSPGSQAYFLAATLLETIFEHEVEQPARFTAVPQQPCCISLSDCVPPPAFCLDADSVRLPHSQNLLRLLYQPWSADWLLPQRLTGPSIPETTKTELQNLAAPPEIFNAKRTAQLSFSIYTDGSANQAKGQSGYAVVVLSHADSDTALLGALGDELTGCQEPPWRPEGPLALHAEHIAIAVAVLWTMQMRGVLSVVKCTLLFDCTAAGWSAEGKWQTSGPTSEFVHNLYMAARATPGIHIEFRHVRGHSNDPWNDLADHVAKTAANQTCEWPRPPPELCGLFASEDISWIAPELDARAHHAVPILDGTLTWSDIREAGAPLTSAQLVPTTCSAADDADDTGCFSLRAVTVNIQSLRGKCKYVEDQLDARGVNVAFLQETKLSGGTLMSAHYLRLHTDADSHWGVGIWVHRRLGVLSLHKRALLVDESDFTVLHGAPRLLVVLLTVGDLKIGLVSGHCPHAARPRERDEFLATLGPLLQRLKHTNLLLGGIDLNGRPPPAYEGVTGNLEYGEPDTTGWSAVQILADAGVWIPSTYSQLHCGESATYVHPSGQQHRIDYLLVGGRARVHFVRSETDETFDNGSPQEDHTLLCADLTGSTVAPHGQRKLLRPVYDRDKLLSSEGRALVRDVIAAFPHPAWGTHPDQHCVQIETYLRKALDTHFAQPQKAKRASYIPDCVWKRRDAKMQFKRRVRHRMHLWHDLLCRAFYGWQTCQDYGVGLLLGKQSLLYELASAAIRFVTAEIKKSISKAKNAFLFQLAGENSQGAATIMQKAKKAGVGGSKTRPVSRPLPLLLHPENGSAAASRDQRDAVWLLHFGKQEQGQIVSTADFIRGAESSCYEPNVVWTAAMLPTYGDIEKVLRDVQHNKAMGLDNIPGEILKAAPAETARLLFPLFIKSMLLQRQPLQWRGGVLYEAFKRSGLQSSVENYRSLFVSSYVAKAYHRTVRNKTQEFCRDELHPMHLGSRKQAPVTFAALFVLTHLRRCHGLHHSSAVLYLDTSAAYYRIVRELAVGDIRCDTTVLMLFRRFGLDAEDVDDLMQTVEAGGMLAQAGAPDALRQVVKDLHLHTWFVSRFADGTRVCDSLAGSRPGESWADLIYAYIYSRVLHKIHEHAVAEDLTFTVPYDQAAGIFPPVPGTEDLAVTDTTWADDSAFPLEDVDASVLMRKTVRLCTLVLSFCTSHGMAPNLKPGKTSVMIALAGKGSRQARRDYFPGGTQRLWLPDLQVGVAVTDQYKHLGGVVDCKLTMKPEVRFRLAQAASSYDAAKALLLNSPKLELPTRAALFASIVTPTFFNLGLWMPHGEAWEMLSCGYSKLVRRLLITDIGAHEVLHVPLPVAHWCTGCWRLELVATRARLSLLVSLATAGPPLLWAMLQSEAKWLQVLQADLQWLVSPEEPQWPKVIEPAWPEWHFLLRTAPQRFKRFLRRRLCQAHAEQCERDAALLGQWHCYRALVQSQQIHAPALSWLCRICAKTFKTKAALGAHFFKVHGRVAEYRHVTAGTKCEACDTDFWTEGRLAAHLRSSPGCVSFLQRNDKSVRQIRPGFGSKQRRQGESQSYTLSVPLRQGHIPPTPVTPSWSAEQTSVYRATCDLLFALQGTETYEMLLLAINTVLQQSPLYPDEIDAILDTLIAEVQEVTADDTDAPWSVLQVRAIMAALADLRSGLWTDTKEHVDRRLYHSLREFHQLLTGFDWAASLKTFAKGDVTPSILEYSVPPDWKAEWQRNCSRIEVSAVARDLGAVLPEVLRRAWASLTTGCTVVLHAPQDFWNSAIAAPFQPTRASFCKHN